MKFKVYKLHFTAPLHISNQRNDGSVSLKTIQSDTLYAALTACLAKVGEALPVGGDFGCAISSLFPYYERKASEDYEGKLVYFLPMPLQSRMPELEDVALAKKVKRVQWVDSALYGSLLSGEQFFDGKKGKTDQIHGVYVTEAKLPLDFVKSDVMQRASVADRTGTGDAMPFYIDRITFRYDSGLYFIATGDTAMLDRALNLLKQEGLGTDRHVGFGYFDVEEDEMEIDVPQNTKYMVSLSLFIPEENEKKDASEENGGQLKSLLNDEYIAYDFVRRGGWITTYPHNTLRKNVIYGFVPGSVFCKIDKMPMIDNVPVIGKIVDLKPNVGSGSPEHSIWRNGKAIMLPINI